ncbi:hypothetical protein D0C16_04065 [Cellvibrio sp. KY-GH-1]|uniref:hypothetical protein n=1 Tax=Cellvibrio sp. KY-GH-1 TaxID=2303332 RepID=UPI00124682FC|nr:hypothetical protein [Cellvibrio sp. KY-GH-1]QEY15220.1 hypothetical protein D0C16_04065 [Cellvibrio sp. KY-GH-1]
MLNENEQRTNSYYRFISWTLIALSILANAGMAHHPRISASQPEAQIEQMAQIAGLTMHVHGLLSLVVLVYVWLFALYAAAKNTPIVWLGSGVFAAGGLAMTGAALISGFLAPAMLLGAEINTAEQVAIFKFQSRLLMEANQVLANAAAFAWLCAVICWSSNLVRDNKFFRWVGFAGLLMGGTSLCVVATGNWVLNVKGMSLFVLIISLWFCALACCLLWNSRR